MLAKMISDPDQKEQSREELFGQRAVLIDLYIEFQGADGAFASFAVLLPGLMVVGVFFDWIDEDMQLWWLVGAAVLFIVFTTLSVHSWLWFRWVRRRERRVSELLARGRPDLDV